MSRGKMDTYSSNAGNETMAFISRTGSQKETTPERILVPELKAEAPKPTTIERLISGEISQESLSDSEVKRISYAIEFGDFSSGAWYSEIRPALMARLENMDAKKLPATRIYQESKSCSACGNSGMFTTLAGNICDDCI